MLFFFFFHFRCAEWERSGVPSPLNIPKDNALFDCFVTNVLCREKFNVKRTYCRFDPSARVLAHFADLTGHTDFRRVPISFSSGHLPWRYPIWAGMWVIGCRRTQIIKSSTLTFSAVLNAPTYRIVYVSLLSCAIFFS
jgi:hypothetical protein